MLLERLSEHTECELIFRLHEIIEPQHSLFIVGRFWAMLLLLTDLLLRWEWNITFHFYGKPKKMHWHGTEKSLIPTRLCAQLNVVGFGDDLLRWKCSSFCYQRPAFCSMSASMQQWRLGTKKLLIFRTSCFTFWKPVLESSRSGTISSFSFTTCGDPWWKSYDREKNNYGACWWSDVINVFLQQCSWLNIQLDQLVVPGRFV